MKLCFVSTIKKQKQANSMFTDKLLDKLMNVINKQMAGTKIQLDNPTSNQLRDSMMVLTRKMHTEDVGSYLTKVIRHIDTPNLFIKSLINYYLINIKHNTTVLMLIINTTLKDLNDNDYFKIQGLRVATNVKNSDIQQFFVSRIHKLMSDKNFMVRLCSVIASISIFQHNYDKFVEYKFGEMLMKMMGDNVLAVRECVLIAISVTDMEINLELLVSNAEKRSKNERIAILRIIRKRLEEVKRTGTDFKMVEEDDNGDLISLKDYGDDEMREGSMKVEHDKDKNRMTGTFLLSKATKKFLTHALRSQNHVSAILAAQILVHSKVFHHLIFNSLIYFLDTIYSPYILEFFLTNGLNYDSKQFFIFHNDRKEIKRLKLLILCDIMNELAISEIKRYHYLFNNKILECLILKEYKDQNLIKRIIVCGLEMDNSADCQLSNKSDSEKKLFVDEYLTKSTLEMLVKLQSKITFNIDDILSDIEPKNNDISHYLVLAQHFLAGKPKTLDYIERQKMTFLQCTELLNFYLSLTKRGIYLDIPDIEWPSALTSRVNLLREYNEKKKQVSSISENASFVLEYFSTSSTVPDGKLSSAHYNDTNNIGENYQHAPSMDDGIAVEMSVPCKTYNPDNENCCTGSEKLLLQEVLPQIEPKMDKEPQERQKAIDFAGINNYRNEMFNTTDHGTQSDVSIVMNTKILASLSSFPESDNALHLGDETVKNMISGTNTDEPPNITDINGNKASITVKECTIASQRVLTGSDNAAKVICDKREDCTSESLPEMMHLETLSNEYFDGVIYLADKMLYLDIKELKNKFRFTYNNRGITVDKKQRVGIKSIKEDDINKVINYKTNTTFRRLHLCISKFIKPKEVSMDEFIKNFSYLADYEILNVDSVNYLNVYFLDSRKFCFSVFDKWFYGEIFSLQVILKSNNRKYLKMIKAMKFK